MKRLTRRQMTSSASDKAEEGPERWMYKVDGDSLSICSNNEKAHCSADGVSSPEGLPEFDSVFQTHEACGEEVTRCRYDTAGARPARADLKFA